MAFGPRTPSSGSARPNRWPPSQASPPLNADSGLRQGRRRIRAGRKRIRDALYMAALAAVRCSPRFGDFHRRLIAAGKRPKLAVARKLLVTAKAVLRDQVAFHA